MQCLAKTFAQVELTLLRAFDPKQPRKPVGKRAATNSRGTKAPSTLESVARSHTASCRSWLSIHSMRHSMPSLVKRVVLRTCRLMPDGMSLRSTWNLLARVTNVRRFRVVASTASRATTRRLPASRKSRSDRRLVSRVIGACNVVGSGFGFDTCTSAFRLVTIYAN